MARDTGATPYKEILDALPCAVLVHDERIIYANDRAVELLEAPSQAALVGRSIEDIVHPDALEAGRTRRKLLLESGTGFVGLPVKVRTLAGTDLPLVVDALRVELPDGPAICLVGRSDT